MTVAPNLLTPIATIASNVSSVRTPPAALTCIFGADRSAHQDQVFHRGAARREASTCLDEIGARILGEVTRGDLLVIGQVRILEDHLDERARSGGDVDNRLDVRSDIRVVATAQPPDVDDHVEFARAVV